MTAQPGDLTYDAVVQGVPVNILGSAIRTVSGTLQSAAVATGVGTPLVVTGCKVAAIQVISTATSFTLDIEATVDGTNYVGSLAVLPATDATQLTYVTSISASGLFSLVCAGFSKIQANITAVVGGPGSVTVKAIAVA
jgi:hypothetical protein